MPKADPTAARRMHRHIGANLSDEGLQQAPGVLRYLESRGRVAMMTKAASYLLWRDDFALMRGYVAGHAAFMFADSTGLPPRHWKKAGCTVETYGTFKKSFLPTWAGYQEELAQGVHHPALPRAAHALRLPRRQPGAAQPPGGRPLPASRRRRALRRAGVYRPSFASSPLTSEVACAEA